MAICGDPEDRMRIFLDGVLHLRLSVPTTDVRGYQSTLSSSFLAFSITIITQVYKHTDSQMDADMSRQPAREIVLKISGPSAIANLAALASDSIVSGIYTARPLQSLAHLARESARGSNRRKAAAAAAVHSSSSTARPTTAQPSFSFARLQLL